MEKKTSAKDVHKYGTQQDFVKFYKEELSKALGDDNPFAKISNGVECYVWSDNRCEWQCLKNAGEIKREMVMEEVYHTKSEIAGKVGEKTAEILFTYPDDSYIYYNEDGGNIKILITGWGFKKPVRINPKPDIDDIVVKNEIAIAFVRDGERLTNYDFGLQLKRQVKHLQTNADGVYPAHMNPGEQYTLIDLNTGQQFSLNIVEGQSLYTFDVTKHVSLVISAHKDESPIVGERVDVVYHGRNYEATTDGMGQAVVQLPWHEGETASATMLGQTQTTQMTASGGQINFVFESEHKAVDVQVIVMRNGEPQPDQSVTIYYAGQTYHGTTDAAGIFRQQVQFAPEVICTASVPGYDAQSNPLVDGAVNKFLFETTTPPPPPNPYLNPRILVQTESGEPLGGYPISVEYEGEVNHYITTPNGVVTLPEMHHGKAMTVVDDNFPEYSVDYLLDSEQEEYVFVIPERDYKIMFRDMHGAPVVCDNVSFVQDGRPDVVATLDANGDTYLKKDTFVVGLPISAKINGWENREDYAPVRFTLEQDELEYLLQEKEPEDKSPWWKVVLEILAVLLALMALWFLWPYFERLCWEAFEMIYK